MSLPFESPTSWLASSFTGHGRGHGRGRKRDHDPLLGTWLDGRFLIERRIAMGGFGAVYQARGVDGLPVALKVLHPWLTSDADVVARFRREGATLTQLHDPHTVTTLAVGETADGMRYIAMELLTGESLHDRLRRDGALGWPAAVAIARAVCCSLAEAHALGVIHRDLKPANIHVERRDGREAVKVLDFGIVKIARGSAIDDGRELTYAGRVIGTFEYMSPEQLVGDPCRDTADIYALGLILYEMLTGRRPFPHAADPASMLAAMLTQTPVAPSRYAELPDELERLVMRCLARDPDHRFADVRALIAALDGVAAPRRRTPRGTTHPAPRGSKHPTLPGFAVIPARSSRLTLAPITEAPVADAPITDAPVADAPVADAPRAPIAALALAAPMPTAARPVARRIGWNLGPDAIAWVPAPARRIDAADHRLASGSGPQPRARTHRAMWLGLALATATACAAAIALAATMI
jgi:serine/threonine-protein kinase